MADRRTPLQEAVDHLSGDAGREQGAPRRADAIADAAAIAAHAAGLEARDADPSTADLEPLDAVMASSGIAGWRVRLGSRWWRSVPVPLVVQTPDGAAAVLPAGRRPRLVAALTRRATILHRGGLRERVEPVAMAIPPALPVTGSWLHLALWSVRGIRHDLATLVVLSLCGAVIGLLLPAATSAIFESAVPAGDLVREAWILVALAAGSIGAGLVAMAAGLYVVRIRDTSDAILAPALVARLLRLRAGFFRGRPTGDALGRAMAVDAARDEVDDSLLTAVLTAAFGLVNVLFLFSVDAGVGAVAIILAAGVLVVNTAQQVRQRGTMPALIAARSATDGTLMGLMGSLVSWRMAGAEDRAFARWAISQGRSTRAMAARLRSIATTAPIDAAAPLFVLTGVVIATILIPGDRLRAGSSGAPGAFMALYVAATQVAVAMSALGWQLVALAELGPILRQALPIVEAPVERAEAAASPGRLRGAVSLSNVVFGYREGETPLLDGLSLSVEPGEMLAVVGPSGSGKSTVMRLLLGFEQPWSGTVAYDGRDLAGLDPVLVRRQLGVVLQASRPLGATVRESVTGARRMSDADVLALLDEAGLGDDVRRMPMGLDAPVGDHGLLLSGGQRQRLMIAAALAGDPRILLMDEATSALDNMTQAVVMRTLLGSSATRIVVAHRMSTVRDADRVVVVSGGRIVEEGAPAELLALGGHFARLARRQEV